MKISSMGDEHVALGEIMDFEVWVE